MIAEYFRPSSVSEALELLTDPDVTRKPLGGGTQLSRNQTGEFGVVDLQDTGLDQIDVTIREVAAGAMVRLSDLLTHSDVHPEIKRAIRIDASENTRNAASLGGWMVSSGGRSILSAVLLALDATLTWEPDNVSVRLGDWLPLRVQESPGVLMTRLTWSKQPNLAFEYVSRTPNDRPLLIVATAQWPSGRTRLALGGCGDSAVIAMDGTEESGIDLAARDAYFEAGDQWATAQYRREVAPKLALRCLDKLHNLNESED